MNISGKIRKIDSLLDQLDALAQQDTPADRFWQRWMDDLHNMTDASHVGLWFEATIGESQPFQHLHAWKGQTTFTPPIDSTCSTSIEVTKSSTEVRFCSVLSASHNVRWLIQVTCPGECAEPVVSALSSMIAGFIEIARRYLSQQSLRSVELESRLDQWVLQLHGATDRRAAEYLICETLPSLLNADRISLFHRAASSVVMRRTTGLAEIKSRTAVVRDLEQWISELSSIDSPTLVVGSLESGSTTSFATDEERRQSVLVQWPDAANLTSMVPYWLRLVPHIEHRLGFFRNQSRGYWRWFGTMARNPMRLATLVLILATGLAFALTQNIKVTQFVHATGRIYPENHRTIYSPCDGYVDTIFVDQDQSVDEGEVLLVLRSPDTELALEDLDGQIASVTQQRDGLRVAINQAKGNRTDDQSLAFQMAADVAGLNARLQGLERQRSILAQENASYRLTSPIHGRVVTKDLKETLASRPVRQGEPLLRICDTTDRWILNLDVDQRDIDLVRVFHSLAADEEADVKSLRNPTVHFRLLSNPTTTIDGTILSVDEVVGVNADGARVVGVDVLFDKDGVSDLQLDASVVAKIACGEGRWWQVWTRELTNELRRRFWIND
jgi:multidrug efflux pump subunit AcrA (membrane-fusion protein)